jgi:hypothetical protein
MAGAQLRFYTFSPFPKAIPSESPFHSNCFLLLWSCFILLFNYTIFVFLMFLDIGSDN